ncbi:MAG: hypothetical protein HY765_04890 [Rhodomicrobium sp.]|nr:hypothetical protein [Rhodomicrobium sp.]
MGGFRNLTGGILFGLAFAIMSIIGSAAAKDTVLTRDNVTRFLASFAEMRDIAIAEGLRTGMDSAAAKNPLAAVLKAIKSTKLKTEAEKIVQSHGFADVKDWAGTGRSIAQAYIFITTGPSRGVARATLEKHKDNAISQLEKLGFVNAKNKQKLKDNLDDLSDQLSREPPAENAAIVKQMKPDIDAAVKIGGN